MKRLLLIATVALIGCSSKPKDPCFEDLGCRDCNELFDRMQANLGNPDSSKVLSDCYNKNCKD